MAISKLAFTVCRKPSNSSFVLPNAVVETVRVLINAILFVFFEADVRSFEIKSLRDVNVTRISDTLCNGFPQTVTEIFSKSQISGMKIDITPIRSGASAAWITKFAAAIPKLLIL